MKIKVDWEYLKSRFGIAGDYANKSSWCSELKKLEDEKGFIEAEKVHTHCYETNGISIYHRWVLEVCQGQTLEN